MSVGQMAIGPVVLGGPGLDAAYQYLARTTRTKWAKKERVGKPTIHEFIGAEQDILTIEGVIYPLAARWRGGAAGADRVGPRISDLGAGQLGGVGVVELLRRMARSGKPWLIVLGSGEVCGLWVITEVEERLDNFRDDGVAHKSLYRLRLRHYGMTLAEYAARLQQQPREQVTSTVDFGGEAPPREQVTSTVEFGEVIDPE